MTNPQTPKQRYPEVPLDIADLLDVSPEDFLDFMVEKAGLEIPDSALRMPGICSNPDCNNTYTVTEAYRMRALELDYRRQGFKPLHGLHCPCCFAEKRFDLILQEREKLIQEGRKVVSYDSPDDSPNFHLTTRILEGSIHERSDS